MQEKIEGNRARGSTYFVVVVQSYPLERDDFVCLAILGFEHGAISACNEKQAVEKERNRMTGRCCVVTAKTGGTRHRERTAVTSSIRVVVR